MSPTQLQFATPRFGELTVEEERLVHFPAGVIGLADCRRFVRLPFADADLPFEWLQCVENADIAFLTADPQAFFPEYAVTVAPDTLNEIELTDERTGEVRCILTVPDQVADMTANLLAPIVLNTRKRLAMQVVLSDPRYATKHRLFPEVDSHAGTEPPD